MENGYVLYEGNSKLNGEPIVIIATGFSDSSANTKTGDMVQTWILLQNEEPHKAIKTGADSAICGDCVHRGEWNGKTWVKRRTCYVKTFQAPLAVYRKYKRNGYKKANLAQQRTQTTDRVVRIGSYGDPMAAPRTLWENFIVNAKAHTGYTHQWKKTKSKKWANIVMASVENEKLAKIAQHRGYRTFRVLSEPTTSENEILCPASKEAGQKTICEKCKLCSGTTSNSRKSIAIVQH